MYDSHSHVVATIDEKDDQTVEYLPLDLELVEATTEYSARLDLLSYITQQTLANIEERLMSDTCIGDPEQLASLLEKASLENDDRVHRFVPAGEVGGRATLHLAADKIYPPPRRW